MLVYLRKVNSSKEDTLKWLKHWGGDISSIKNRTYKEHFEEVLQEDKILNEENILYTVEKGDEEYGLFSYAIAGVCLTNIDISTSSCELVMLPNDDEEWNDEAKTMTLRLLLEAAFHQWEMREVYVYADKERELSWFEAKGFQLESMDDSISGQKKHAEMVKLKLAKKRKIMKILVTGAAGKLGHDLVRELHSRGHEVLGSDILEEYELLDRENKTKIPYVSMNVINDKEVFNVIGEFAPDAVIHCAAWTAVDDAEREENRNKVYDINVRGTENVALACRNCDSKLMYITTDYVFNGEGSEPWKADSRDFEPLNYYGRTKLEGEQKVVKTLSTYFIIRTEWAFGENGKNFVDIMLDIAKRRKRLAVVDDQIGTPTYCYDLSVLLADIIETQKYGYYNATNSGGYVSRYEFAKEIFRQAAEQGHLEYSEENLLIHPSATEEYSPSITVRPLNSRLDLTKLKENGFSSLPSWKDALSRYLRERNWTNDL